MSDQLSNLILATTRLTGIESDDLAARIRDQFLVIPRTDLPEVEVHDWNGALVDATVELRDGSIGTAQAHPGTGSPNSYAEWHRAKANAHLALAEYLDAHPPIDEAQVNTLATLLRDTGARPSGADAIPIARRLIATGRVTITPDGGAS